MASKVVAELKLADAAVPPCRDLLLDNQHCFALYVATNAVTRAHRKPLAELGLAYPQYPALLVL